MKKVIIELLKWLPEPGRLNISFLEHLKLYFILALFWNGTALKIYIPQFATEIEKS